ncbi:MAG: hypothetical protein ACW98J_10245, partial [Candidatus Thorarchaeota archaeon]
MPRFRRRRLLIGFLAVCGVVILASTVLASAQAPPEGWFGDEDHLHARILINGASITDTSQTQPISISLETDTNIYIEIDVIGTQAIHHLQGAIGFWYQSIKVFEVNISQANLEVLMQPDDVIPPVQGDISIGDFLSTSFAGISIDLITGKFEASVSLYYLLEGEVNGVDTPHSIEQIFFLTIPYTSTIDAITSVAGIATTV